MSEQTFRKNQYLLSGEGNEKSSNSSQKASCREIASVDDNLTRWGFVDNETKLQEADTPITTYYITVDG